MKSLNHLVIGDLLGSSFDTLLQILSKTKETRIAIPNFQELFGCAAYIADKLELSNTNISSLPEWDLQQDLLKEPLTEGIYQTNDKIIFILRVEKGEFKNLTLFCGGSLADSRYSKILQGYYVIFFQKAENSQNTLIPCCFTYLVKDEILNGEIKNIVPLPATPSDIDPDAQLNWVFIAMKFFNENFSDKVPYEYLHINKDKNINDNDNFHVLSI